MCWRGTPWSTIFLVFLTLASTAIGGPRGYYLNEVNFVKRTPTTPDTGGVILPVACPAPWVSEILYVGQKPTVARVQISLITTNPPGIKITYTYAPGYLYTDAHVYVGTGPVPTNNAGNPAPGQFPFNVSKGYCNILDGGKKVECIIPYSSFGYDTSVCDETKYYTVAAHAALVPESGSVTSSETGWAGEHCIVPGCKPWGKYFTFHFCCPKPEPTPTPTPEPETPGCETAFGRVNGPPGSYKTFDQLPNADGLPERWGWQNEANCAELSSGVSGDLIAGAGNGIGTDVGSWSAKLTNGILTVSYSTGDTVWYMEGTHLYVSTTEIQNLAPGKFPYKHGSLTTVETDGYLIPWTSCSGTVYIVLHADVCKGGAHKD